MTTMQALGATYERLEIGRWIERAAAVGPLPARFLMAFLFIHSGIGKIVGFEQTAGFMSAHHMPLVHMFLVLTIMVELGAGLALLTGFHGRIAALVLFLFLIPTTLIFHNFWAFTGMDHMMQMINFLKNTSIMGGLLMVASLGPGGLSVDSWRKRGRSQ